MRRKFNGKKGNIIRLLSIPSKAALYLPVDKISTRCKSNRVAVFSVGNVNTEAFVRLANGNMLQTKTNETIACRNLSEMACGLE